MRAFFICSFSAVRMVSKIGLFSTEFSTGLLAGTDSAVLLIVVFGNLSL
jgi:hypothetical protein